MSEPVVCMCECECVCVCVFHTYITKQQWYHLTSRDYMHYYFASKDILYTPDFKKNELITSKCVQLILNNNNYGFMTYILGAIKH